MNNDLEYSLSPAGLAGVRSAFLSAFLALTFAAAAQTHPAGEVHISIGGGSSALKYQIEQNSAKPGTGGNFGFGYTAFFSRNIGITFGLEAAVYQGSAAVPDFELQDKIPTPQGLSGDFFLQAEYSGLKETQTAIMLQLPVMLQFQIPAGQTAFFYAGAGVKIGFPVSAKWKQDIDILTTRGYSNYTGQTYENMPNHGFDSRRNISESGKLPFGTPVYTVFEAGMKFKTSGKNAFYAGIYCDYGLSSIYKRSQSDDQMIEYSGIAPAYFVYNSVLQTENFTVSSNGIRPFAIGLKLRMAFGFGKTHFKSGSDGKTKQDKPNKPVEKKPDVKEPVKPKKQEPDWDKILKPKLG